MQSVSSAYNAYPDARKNEVKATFRFVDTSAADDATASATEYDSASQLAQTHDGIETMTKYATLETNGWPLDGTAAILPDNVTGIETGFWSNISGAGRTFGTAPTLIFEFSANHSSVGFTAVFDSGTHPTRFTIAAYDSVGALISTADVVCTSDSEPVSIPTTNYRKIVLAFTETQQPYQRIRLTEVVFGLVKNYDKHNSKEASVLYEISPIAENLPSNELVIVVDNSDRSYNMVNPSGLYSYLQQSQPIDVTLGVGFPTPEHVNMGRFYYTKSVSKDSSLTAQITANDRFYALGKSTCRIGTTGTWTVSEAVAAIIADSGMSITVSIPANVASRTVNKCIPATATHREALRLVAQAGRSTCYFDRDDVLAFVEMATGTPTDTLDNDNMSEVAELTVLDRINYVEITATDEYTDIKNIYTADGIVAGETAQTLSITNPLVYDGASVAAWLLSMSQHRLRYTVYERGNPAREITDTATVYDAYGENADAVIIKEEYKYDGSLSAVSKGWS